MNIINNTEKAKNIFNKTGGSCIVMPDGTEYSRDIRITGLNNNVAVIGPSGCGKSTVMGTLNALNAGGSLIISDPKGGLYRSLAAILRCMGYEVAKLDLTHMQCSMRYDPLMYIRSSQDIRKMAHSIVFSQYKDGAAPRDPYWENAAESMLCAFIGLLFEEGDRSRMTLTAVMDMLSRFVPYEDLGEEELDGKPVYRCFAKHQRRMEEEGKESWACRMFRPFKSLSERTLSCVISTLTSLLTPFDSEETAALFKDADFDFTRLGREKLAVFAVVSDSDRSNDILANMFYTQAMNELCDYADNCCENGRLPTSVTFILDDFATNCRIDKFDNIISNIRARNISAIILMQSLSQLDSSYGRGSITIMNNCDTVVFMGANSTADAGYFAERANKPLHTMMEMPLHSSWVFRRSTKPRFTENIDPEAYLEDVRRSLEKPLDRQK